jgi:isoaspartyl peptidase/L-asparaginase-like protein (Ntn-hydrolase superfamily)
VAKALLPAAKRESSPAVRGAAPRGQEEELRAVVMVANRQGFGAVACVWDVSKECCKCFMRMLQK